jgi:hypothetical protein
VRHTNLGSLASLVALSALVLGSAGCASRFHRSETQAATHASGVVFHDRDGDGRRGWLERGIANVVVSNGFDVASTDWRGRYRIPVGDDDIVFVAKPSGWGVPLGPRRLPRFYYIHKPKGSPGGLTFPGVAPTGALPESLDFPLRRQHEPAAFRAIVFGDTQTYRAEEIGFLERDVIDELVGFDAAFGITLGDLVGDDLGLFGPLSEAISRIGIPWYQVIGNHDLNFRAADDAHSDETFERAFGPATYAFAYGQVHFIVLDDVVYVGAEAAGQPGPHYAGGLSDRQLRFVERYLATVPNDRLVVLALHIPFDSAPHEVPERGALFKLLRDRPHTLSLVAHTHFQENQFFGEDAGFEGSNPHHQMIVGPVSGSWWLGERDEAGIPHATMRCGAPNGYVIASFDGASYALRFKAAREPADFQMNVFAPEVVAAAGSADTEVLVNVFAGSPQTRVELRVGNGNGDSKPTGDWVPLSREARKDPGYLDMIEDDLARDPRPRFYLPPAMASPHLWVGRLPANPEPGRYTLQVRAIDRYGQVFDWQRPLRVTD